MISFHRKSRRTFYIFNFFVFLVRRFHALSSFVSVSLFLSLFLSLFVCFVCFCLFFVCFFFLFVLFVLSLQPSTCVTATAFVATFSLMHFFSLSQFWTGRARKLLNRERRRPWIIIARALHSTFYMRYSYCLFFYLMLGALFLPLAILDR